MISESYAWLRRGLELAHLQNGQLLSNLWAGTRERVSALLEKQTDLPVFALLLIMDFLYEARFIGSGDPRRCSIIAAVPADSNLSFETVPALQTVTTASGTFCTIFFRRS